ncbi:HK97 gp10 family phage protein [Nonomuraea sp. CA-218870]|uniref:HK97 gp10 family phage protein n=1 Tax=Nonomuraea sp. CA-218870 TaxID=3239998 RepID=UPI003D8EFD0E
MAPKARFRPDYKGIGRILTSKTMQGAMEQRAERVRDRCVADAPEDTGTYKSSFRVETGIRPGPKPRAVSKVVNDDPAAPYVEWGTSRTPRYRAMGRAAGVE